MHQYEADNEEKESFESGTRNFDSDSESEEEDVDLTCMPNEITHTVRNKHSKGRLKRSDKEEMDYSPSESE